MSIRVSPKFKQTVSYLAKQFHCSKSTIIKSKAIGTKKATHFLVHQARKNIKQSGLRKKQDQVLDNIFNDLNTIKLQAVGSYNNLNQLARKANQGDSLNTDELNMIRLSTNNISQKLTKIEDALGLV